MLLAPRNKLFALSYTEFRLLVFQSHNIFVCENESYEEIQNFFRLAKNMFLAMSARNSYPNILDACITENRKATAVPSIFSTRTSPSLPLSKAEVKSRKQTHGTFSTFIFPWTTIPSQLNACPKTNPSRNNSCSF